MQVELRQDLVGSCVVGDVVKVLGLVKVLAAGDAKPAGECRRGRRRRRHRVRQVQHVPTHVEAICFLVMLGWLGSLAIF